MFEENTLRDYGLGPTGARALGQRSQNMYDEEGQCLHVDRY